MIAVPYHLDESLPGLGPPLDVDETVRVPLTRTGQVWDSLASLYEAVSCAVSRAASGHEVPVVLSGDCSTAVGTMSGLQQAGVDPAVVWFDAHGDVQTLETSGSGYLAGMALRMLTDYRPELLASRLGLHPVPEHRIVLAGARDLDPPEVTYLATSRIRRSDVAGLTATSLPSGPLYVHLDLDVVDPADVSGLRFPVPGGPGLAQVAGAMRMLAETGRVAAVGVACSWHPEPAAGLRAPQLLASALRGLAA